MVVGIVSLTRIMRKIAALCGPCVVAPSNIMMDKGPGEALQRQIAARPVVSRIMPKASRLLCFRRLGKSHQPKPATANARLSCSRMILVMVRRRCEHLRLEMFSFRQKGLFVHRKGLPENLRHFDWRFRQCDGGMSMPFYGKVKSSSKSSRAKYWSSSGGLTGT